MGFGVGAGVCGICLLVVDVRVVAVDGGSAAIVSCVAGFFGDGSCVVADESPSVVSGSC